MFKNNKYTTTYFKIIERSRKEERSKKEEYFEAHHIIPTCLDADSCETVLLTPREHFICHLLLPKMVDIDTQIYWKLRYAIARFVSNPRGNQRLNSRQYEKVRRIIAINSSNLNRGRKFTHTKPSIRIGMLWINNGIIETYGSYEEIPEGYVRGRLKFSKDHINKMTIKMIERNRTEEFRLKQAERMKKTMTENNPSKRSDVREKIRQSRLGKSFIHVTKDNVNKCIQPDELEMYLSSGWIRGRYIKSRRKKIQTTL